MPRSTFRALLPLAVLLAAGAGDRAHAGVVGGIGPLPYLCFEAAATTATGSCGTSESPFVGVVFDGYFHLENFEDDTFEPGWTIGGTQTRYGPGGITDSVDEDDGAFDGSGVSGSSNFSFPPATIAFDVAALGALPTHVGFVWTDGGSEVTVTAEFFGPGATPLGSVVGKGIGGPAVTGETAEDRFFGWIDPGGIASVTISHTSGGLEIDHVQYGGPPPPPAPVDPFLCYKAKATKGGPGFEPRSAALANPIATGDASVLGYKALCNPAAVDGEPIEEPASHLASFGMKPAVKVAKRGMLPVTTPLGALSLDTVKPDRLLLPAAKSVEGPVEPLASTSVDPFECFKAKLTKGTPKLAKGLELTVADQFAETRTFLVKKPTRLCVATSVGGSKLLSPEAALVCFKVKPAKGQPKHAKRAGVHVNHVFGPGQLDTVKEEELCLPSTLELPM
jgi:hypothetical protein